MDVVVKTIETFTQFTTHNCLNYPVRKDLDLLKSNGLASFTNVAVQQYPITAPIKLLHIGTKN